MDAKRIHEIQQAMAYPDSTSVAYALSQVWNEVQQENNARIAALEALARQAGEALRWYELQGAGCRKISSDGDVARRALDADGGKKATAILTKLSAAGLLPGEE